MEKTFRNIQKLAIPLTFKCNFKCKYCYVFKDERIEFSRDNLYKLFDFFLKNNEFEDRIIHFYGGEPLLRYDLLKYSVQIVRKIEKKYGKHTDLGVTTNGVFLDDKKIDFLVKNFENFSISIDSLNLDYKYRNVKKMINKLPILLKYKEQIHIKMTIMPDCADSFFNYYRQLLGMGFININVQPAMGFYWKDKQMIAFLNNIIKISKYKKYFDKKSYDIKFKMEEDINDVFDNNKKYCSMVREELAVDALGNVYPCQFFVALPFKLRTKYILGNIFTKKIDYNLIKEIRNLKICKKNPIGIKLNKCETCMVDRFCQKVCYGFNIIEQGFDSKLIENAIYFERLLFKLIREKAIK